MCHPLLIFSARSSDENPDILNEASITRVQAALPTGMEKEEEHVSLFSVTREFVNERHVISLYH